LIQLKAKPKKKTLAKTTFFLAAIVSHLLSIILSESKFGLRPDKIYFYFNRLTFYFLSAFIIRYIENNAREKIIFCG